MPAREYDPQLGARFSSFAVPVIHYGLVKLIRGWDRMPQALPAGLEDGADLLAQVPAPGTRRPGWGR